MSYRIEITEIKPDPRIESCDGEETVYMQQFDNLDVMQVAYAINEVACTIEDQRRAEEKGPIKFKGVGFSVDDLDRRYRKD